MIYGIGIDIVKTERLQKAVERWGDKFLERVFTRNEIAYCYEKNNPFPSLSVRFAAKEALIKAIGAEITVSLTEIDMRTHENGRPFIEVSGRLRQHFDEKKIKSIHLSLSHEREYGVASIVLEGTE